MIQQIFKAILPTKLFEAAKRESLQWKVKCNTCAFEQSLWERGGIRYKAKSIKKSSLLFCKQCEKYKFHHYYKVQ